VALPSLDAAVDVPAGVVAGFRRDGHALVRGVCSAEEVASYRPVLRDAAHERNPHPPPLEHRDTYGKAFVQSMNLWTLDAGARAFVCAPRFAQLAAALLEVDGVRLYHDQALFKEPGGGVTPWHQDQVYWPFDTDRTITMWMPLVDVPDEVGSMTFASGSSAMGDLGTLDISEASEASVSQMVEERGMSLHTYGALRAGDATFHAGWTLHRAGGNPTDSIREVMTVIFYADGARVIEPTNDYQVFDLKVWLGGVEPGQLADSPRNPRLWPPE
jgi:ectoine hydroxylase-related dioxygenase (phytanoyl-CoA dioxygenase family)